MPIEETEKKRRMWDKIAAEDPLTAITVKDLTWESFVEAGRHEADELRAWLESLGCQTKQMRALDLGCGIGRITRFFAESFGEAHGADISPVMIQKAKELWKDVPNLFFNVNSGKDLSVYPDEYFDFVYSVATFLHIAKSGIIASYFKDIARVLKPNGYYKITLNGAKWMPLNLPFGKGQFKLPRFIFNPLVESGVLQRIAALRYLRDPKKAHVSQTYLGRLVTLREIRKLSAAYCLRIDGTSGADTTCFVVWGRKQAPSTR